MKRLLGLILALAMLPVLVAPSPATAVDCPYTGGCEAPRLLLSVPSTVTQGTRPVIKVKVSARSGNAKPVGKVVLVVKRRGGGFSWTKTVFVNGSAKSVRTPRLTKRGRYVVRARFVPKPDTIWRAASSAKTFKVLREA